MGQYVDLLLINPQIFQGQVQQLTAVLVESNLYLVAANLDHGFGCIVNHIHGLFVVWARRSDSSSL